jgi:hypothetical protein
VRIAFRPDRRVGRPIRRWGLAGRLAVAGQLVEMSTVMSRHGEPTFSRRRAAASNKAAFTGRAAKSASVDVNSPSIFGWRGRSRRESGQPAGSIFLGNQIGWKAGQPLGFNLRLRGSPTWDVHRAGGSGATLSYEKLHRVISPILLLWVNVVSIRRYQACD